jgi:hypothetical protein
MEFIDEVDFSPLAHYAALLAIHHLLLLFCQVVVLDIKGANKIGSQGVWGI